MSESRSKSFPLLQATVDHCRHWDFRISRIPYTLTHTMPYLLRHPFAVLVLSACAIRVTIAAKRTVNRGTMWYIVVFNRTEIFINKSAVAGPVQNSYIFFIASFWWMANVNVLHLVYYTRNKSLAADGNEWQPTDWLESGFFSSSSPFFVLFHLCLLLFSAAYKWPRPYEPI